MNHWQLAGCTPVVSRRHLLQIGGLGLAGLSLPRLLAAEQEATTVGLSPRADACIVLFLNGGPSHLDMWDMKPDAPEAIRGEFKPISTSVAGLQFSEHLPLLAQLAHRSTIVRSMRHTVNDSHALAVYTSLTGHDRGDAKINVGNGGEDYPCIGAVLAKVRPPERPIVSHATLPFITKEGAGGPPQPGFFGGFLGRAYDPLFVLKDPNSSDFAVPELTLHGDISLTRLEARQSLFASIDRALSETRVSVGSASSNALSERSRSASPTPYDSMDSFRRQALNLLTSRDTQDALRIADEPAAVRERYGRNIYGQSVLLARRLIEAGTRLVTISWAPDANATWDTHGQNFAKLKQTLLPQFDAACSSLIMDLAERDMLDRTIVAVLGDFGRSPKINKDAGRDHWNYCYSLALFGGGFRGGFVYGASDKSGAFPARDPLLPGDITATLYHLLGVPHDRTIYDIVNRPHRLVASGNVVPELLL